MWIRLTANWRKRKRMNRKWILCFKIAWARIWFTMREFLLCLLLFSSSPESWKGTEMCFYMYNNVLANCIYFSERKHWESWLKPVCFSQRLWHSIFSLNIQCLCYCPKSWRERGRISVLGFLCWFLLELDGYA